MRPGDSSHRTRSAKAVVFCLAIAAAFGPAARSQEAPRCILHRNGRFDPALRVRSEPASPFGVRTGTRLRFVQFRDRDPHSASAALRDAEAATILYVPDAARLVECDEGAAERLRRDPRVRAVAPFLGTDRARTVDVRLAMEGRLHERLWHVVYRRAHVRAAQSTLLEALGPLGVSAPFGLAERGSVGVLRLSPQAFVAALGRDEILWCEPYEAPTPDMDVVRQVFGADAAALSGAAGFSGADVGGQILDFGPRLSHVDISGLAFAGVSAPVPTSHGTATTAIAFGRGQGDPTAAGMLPAGRAIGGYALAPMIAADRYGATEPLLSPPYEAVFQSNSWGGANTLDYGTAAFGLDEIAFDLDLLIVQSQGNLGGPLSRAEAWAKNVVSVGGVLHFGTASAADDQWGGAASTGPASDGRIKPDLVGFSDLIRTAAETGDSAYTSFFSGTSAATPAVAGAAGLLAEMFARGVFGNRPFGPTIFSRRPRAATLKALLIDGAAVYPFSGTGADLSRMRQGFGRPDVAASLAHGQAGRVDVVDGTAALVQGGVFQRTYAAATPGVELRATLVWPDPPAAPFAAVHRVNDFDLEVVAPDGTVYRGNFGLDQGPYSQSGGTADAINTVEQVRIAAPLAGVWTVRVIAATLNVDGRPETQALDGVFSLVVSGATANAVFVDVGHPSSDEAWLLVDRPANLGAASPGPGVPGPFFTATSSGRALTLRIGGAPVRPFLLAAGPLGRGNLAVPGIGGLDLGLLGPSDLSDVSLLMNGLFPATFLDYAAFTGADGTRELGFTIPSLPPGVLGALQAAVLTADGTGLRLSAAVQVEIY